MMDKGRSMRAAMNKVAAETALLQARARDSFTLALQHIPGAHNQWADALSRLAEPGSGAAVPPPLAHLPRTPAPPRGPAAWISMAGPDSPLAAEALESAQAQGVRDAGGWSGEE